jgi:hypothetical protein
MERELDELLPLLRGRAEELPKQLADALESRVHLLIEQGRSGEAVTAVDELARLAQAYLAQDRKLHARTDMLKALALQFTDDYQGALSAAHQALAANLELYDARHATVLDARGLYGRALGNLGRSDDAVRELKIVVEQAHALTGVDSPMVAFYSADIARFQYDADYMLDSLKHAERSLELLSRMAEPTSITVLIARKHVGRALLGLRRLAEAQAVLLSTRQAAGSLEDTRGRELLDDLDAHLALIDLWAQDGDATRAANTLDRLLARETLNSRGRITVLHFRGIAARLGGALAQAERLQQEAIAGLSDTSPNLRRDPPMRGELFHLLVARNAHAAALSAWAALRLDIDQVPTSARQAELLVSYARSALAQGDSAAAEIALRSAARFWLQIPQAPRRWADEVAAWQSRAAAAQGT